MAQNHQNVASIGHKVIVSFEYKKRRQLVPPVDYNLQHLNQAHQSGDLNRSLPTDNLIQHVIVGSDDTNLKCVGIDVTIKTATFRTCNYTNCPTILKSVNRLGSTGESVIVKGQSREVHWSGVVCELREF
jgi:hypothetical protein